MGSNTIEHVIKCEYTRGQWLYCLIKLIKHLESTFSNAKVCFLPVMPRSKIGTSVGELENFLAEAKVLEDAVHKVMKPTYRKTTKGRGGSANKSRKRLCMLPDYRVGVLDSEENHQPLSYDHIHLNAFGAAAVVPAIAAAINAI